MTHVVFLISKYGRWGGVKALVNLSDFLVEQGYKSEIVVVGGISTDTADMVSSHTSLPVPRIIETILERVPRLSFLWEIVGFVDFFFYLIRTPATHVVCNFHMQVYPARLAQILTKRTYRIVYYIQAYEADIFPKTTVYQGIRRFLARRTYKMRTEQLVNSMNYHDIDPNITNESSRCLPPSVNMQVYHPLPKTNDKQITVGTLYSPAPFKGSDTAVDTLKLLRSYDVPLQLVIGTSYKFISDGSLQVVHIANDEDLIKFYQSLDILISLPHKRKGAAHYPIFEGWACGCAQVCTSLSLTEHLVNSLVVAPRSSAETANAVRSLIVDPVLRMRLVEGGMRTVQRVSTERIGRLFENSLFGHKQKADATQSLPQTKSE